MISHSYIIACGLFIVTCGLTLSVLREPPATEGSVEYLRMKAGRPERSGVIANLYAGFAAPLHSKDFFLISLARMFYYGSTACMSMLLFFFRDCLNETEPGARRLLGVAALIAYGSQVPIALSLGPMSDTLTKRRRMYIAGCIFSGVACLICISTPGMQGVGFSEVGVAIAIYTGAILYGLGAVGEGHGRNRVDNYSVCVC